MKKSSKKTNKKNSSSNIVSDLILRYFILIIVAVPNLYLFYLVFTPLTIYPVFSILGLFYDVILQESTIFIGELPLEIIPACIAGSAYYLLLVLNLATPQIKINKRIKMILLAFASLLALNIFRIILLSVLAINANSYFDITHQVFWYLISTVFVVGIWFYEVKVFNVKKVPFYSDLKMLYSSARGK